MLKRSFLLILWALLPMLVTVHAPKAAQLGEVPGRPRLETVLFMGSSTITNWQGTMQDQFPQYRTVTECLSGTDYNYLISIARQAVTRHKPDRIVIYSGDNDLAADPPSSPQTVARNFERVVELIRGLQSDTPIYVFSIKPAPGRRELLPQVRETNALVRAAASQLHRVYYVDVFSRMIGANDDIPEKNFDPADSMRIHLSPTGYKLWTDTLQSKMHNE